MIKYGIRIFAITMLFIIVLSACGFSRDQVKIKVGEVTRSIFYAPEYVAFGKGFFQDEGLDVELQTTFGGDKTTIALLSDNIDIALVGAETSIYIAQQGADDPVTPFAQLTQTDGTFLVAREKQNGWDWNRLKGSVFLGQRKGGMPQMAGEFTLKKHGIDPRKDLELIQNVDFVNLSSAFSFGTGQYVQLFEPQASILEQAGIGYVVASFGVECGQLPYTVFMAKKSYIVQNEEIIQKFTNAIYKAQQWVEKKTVEEVTDAIFPYFKDVDRQIVLRAVKRYKEQQSYAIDPVLDEQKWSNLLDVLDAAGELKRRIQLKQIVNNEFAKRAKEKI